MERGTIVPNKDGGSVYANWQKLALELEEAERVERNALKQVVKARQTTKRLKVVVQRAAKPHNAISRSRRKTI